MTAYADKRATQSSKTDTDAIDCLWGRKVRIGYIVALLISLHSCLLAWSALRHSPTWSEVAHLPAGISHWKLGRFDLHRVNPPLIRLVASIPVLFVNPNLDWTGYDASPGIRSERTLRHHFLEQNGERSFWLYTIARWACIPFSWIGAYVCYRWSRELYGDCGGLLTLALWCFSPNIITHAQLITPDLGASSIGICGAYRFRAWLRDATRLNAVFAGMMLGLAALTKLTWIILFMLWPMIWIVWRKSTGARWHEVRHQALQMAAILLAGIIVLNAGYAFEGVFRPLGDFHFYSKSLAGVHADDAISGPGNRFSDTICGDFPIPLPENYVMGIDLQKWDFERKMLSYLAGEWKEGGWWYYYLYAIAIKAPLGTLLLTCALSFVPAPLNSAKVTSREEWLVLSPAAILLLFVSSQTGFSHHLRYVLPTFPFLFVWLGRTAFCRQRCRFLIQGALFLLVWSCLSSIWVYPHSLSYFNEVIGGPTRGHEHLGGIRFDSNIDAGQDLLFLKRWIATHPSVHPLYVEFNGLYPPTLAGINSTSLSRHTSGAPGVVAISVSTLLTKSPEFARYANNVPVDRVGYSIHIYRLDTSN